MAALTLRDEMPSSGVEFKRNDAGRKNYLRRGVFRTSSKMSAIVTAMARMSIPSTLHSSPRSA